MLPSIGPKKQDSDVLPCFGKSSLISAQPTLAGFLHGMARFEAFRDIENPLIAATPEVELQTPLRQYEGAVDEHIQLRKQIVSAPGCRQTAAQRCSRSRRPPRSPVPSGALPAWQSPRPGRRARRRRRSRPGTGDCFPRTSPAGASSSMGVPPGEGPGLRVVAAGAVMGTALTIEGGADAGTVYNAVLGDSSEIKHCRERPCFTRSRSSARLASFHLSMVPTR